MKDYADRTAKLAAPSHQELQRAYLAQQGRDAIQWLGARHLLHPDCERHYQCPDRIK